ncbi:MAG: metallophosphoesterase [Prevotellaceae bacterium]|nr:metallophosphoesterase [Prevotellaceae bacterium]
MPYIILATLLVIAVVPDVYIACCFLRHAPLVWRLLYWLPLTAMVALLAVGLSWHPQQWMFRTLIVLLLCTALPKFLFFLFSVVGKGVALFLPAASTAGNGLGILAAVAVIVMAAYGFAVGWKRVTVREVEIAAKELPAAFDGYRMVQLSDLHVGTYSYSPKTLERIVRKVNALHADAVLFTGDLVNASADEVTPFQETLARLAAKDGVYSILGNHDYCTYGHFDSQQARAASLKKLILAERQMGWDLLLNEHRVIRRGSDSIALVGVENDGVPPFPALADLPRAMQGLPDSIYTVLMSHDPTHWRRKVLPDTKIQLTLSGHTHAMQLKFGRFSPSKWAYPEWGGLYREGERLLFVSTGSGSNVPFRFGAWPEIDVLTLRRSASK